MGRLFTYVFLFVLITPASALRGQGGESEGILAYWSFDSLFASGVIRELPVNHTDTLSGYSKLQEGVKGSCLKLDGYTTKIQSDPIKISKNELSIEGWLALQSYPWNLSPVINQGDIINNHNSIVYDFLLGLNAHGSLVFMIRLEDSLYTCISDNSLPLLSWNHIVVNYNGNYGINLYINGEPAGQNSFHSTSVPQFKGSELWLGTNLQKMGPEGSEREASANILSEMVLHGLLDEVRIYDESLSSGEVQARYRTLLPENLDPLTFNRLPSGSVDSFDDFGARYTRLNYTEEWETPWQVGDYPDILVHFYNSPVRYIFWRGTGYGGVWITENDIWMADQSLERVGRNKSPLGCAEHMSDKQVRYSHVRIIENSDARVVIHWRYAISDVLYNIYGAETITDRGEWADEYYYIYPDGISTRYQVLYTDDLSHEWQETIVIHQPGEFPEDNINTEAMTLGNMDGEFETYYWEKGPPDAFPIPQDAIIQRVNLKSEYKPFIIFESGAAIKPFRGAIRQDYSMFPWWNHWPVTQIPNDGRKAFAPDRPSHSSLSQALEGSDAIHRNAKGNFWAVSLTGLTNSSEKDLVTLARSWNQPPELVNLSQNTEYFGHSKVERAYKLRFKEDSRSKEISFQIEASEKTPSYNPVFVIENLNSQKIEIKIGKLIAEPGKDYRLGVIENGSEKMVIIWLGLKTYKNKLLTINLL